MISELIRSIFIHLCWFFDNRAPTIVVIMSTQFAIRQVFKSDGVNNRQQIHTTKYEILFLLKKQRNNYFRGTVKFSKTATKYVKKKKRKENALLLEIATNN